MDVQHENQEITWRTIKQYYDADTGEIITEQQAKEYIQKIKNKHSEKYRTTGVITLTVECTRSRQGKLWD